jgi:DNA-binding transcriptional regulator GbsR (MarR family)
MDLDLINYLASDNYIVVNKTFINIFGLAEAVLLGELCSQYKKWEKEGRLENDMFYSTIDNIEANTGLSAHEQRQAIKSLENAGILYTELKGIPAKKYFKLTISPDVKILTSCRTDFSHQDIKKLHSSIYNITNNIDNNTTTSSSKVKDIIGNKSNKGQNLEENIKWFLEKYHSICVDLPKVIKVTDKRKKSIQKILKSYSPEDIVKVFELVEQSDFLTGKNDRGWKADLDFIVREDKFIAILEGKYGGKKNTHTSLNESGDLYVPHSERRFVNNGTKF